MPQSNSSKNIPRKRRASTGFSSRNVRSRPDSLSSKLSSKTGLTNFREHFRPDNMRKYWFSRKGLRTSIKLIIIGLLLIIIGTGAIMVYLQKDLAAIDSIYGKNLGGSVSYYDNTGKVLLWEDYKAINRLPVTGSAMSPFIRNATVAIEDKNFYHEGAFDFGGILRSAAHDILNPGGQLEGGSTITQQLVKLNENWIGKVTIFRKIKEVFLAADMSGKYSKAEILTGYLDIAPYGGVDYGVQTAAQDYFHTSAAKLTLAQSAMLAAIPQSPSYYSPWSPSFNKSALLTREDYILSLMKQQGYITSSQEKAAQKVNVLAEVHQPVGKYSNIIAPYFVMTAKQQLEKQFGSNTVKFAGWKVITTLSVPQQNEAQKLVAKNQAAVLNDGGDEQAMVVENAPTGQVTAMVGGTNFFNANHGQINYATQWLNPGSTYKLYDYTALINDNNNVGSGSVLYDIQQPLPGYPCTNKALPLKGGNCLYDYDYQYPGALPLEYALAGSRNVPAVKAMLINGEQKTISLSEKMGLTSGYNCYANNSDTIKTTCYASAAIGEGASLRLDQSVNGYATDARLGNYVPQTYIKKIVNQNGKTVYNWKQPKVDQVVKPDAAYIVDKMLSHPGASYLPGSCSATNCTPMIPDFGFKFQHTNGWDVAVKTGTTHNDEAGLMMGMTSQYVVGSWIGYYTAQKKLTPHFGGLEGVTEPLTRGMITYLTQGQKPQNWKQPPGIKTLPAYSVNHPPAQVLGSYYGWQYPSPSTGLYPSWYKPPAISGKPLKIDIVSNSLATSCTPVLAQRTIYPSTSAAAFSIDTFISGLLAAQSSPYNTSQTDNIHHCGDSAPSVSPLNSTTPQCSIGTTGSCTFAFNLNKGTYPLSSTRFPVQVKAIINGNSLAAQCTFNPAIGTSNPPPSTTAQCTVPYSGSGTISFNVQVIDSVLYSGSYSTPQNVYIPQITSPTPNQSISGSLNITWTSSDPQGKYTVSLNGNTVSCTNTQSANNSCQVNNLSPGNYKVTVTDISTNEISPSVSFNET